MAEARDRSALSSIAREQEERSIEREMRHRFTAGDLGPQDIVKFLRDGEIARLEVGLALLGNLDVLRVRELMHGMNKRGFAALCARAGFGAPHYIALCMALDMAEQAFEGAEPESTYAAETIRSGATERRCPPGSPAEQGRQGSGSAEDSGFPDPVHFAVDQSFDSRRRLSSP